MPANINVAVDPRQYAELQATLAGIKGGAAKAAYTAINKTLATGKSRIVKRLAKELNLKQSVISETLKIFKASSAKLEGAIRISKKPIPLMQFNPSPSRPYAAGDSSISIRGRKSTSARPRLGVSVKVRKNKPRQVLKHTFIAQMKSGHVGVFERAGRGASRVARLPIFEHFGPTPQGVFENAPGVAKEILSDMGDVLQKNIASQVNWLLQKKKPPSE